MTAPPRPARPAFGPAGTAPACRGRRARPAARRLLPALPFLLLALLLPLLPSRAETTAPPLSRYPVDPAQVSVSGLSSGAFMASQLHIAHASQIMGVGLIGGGLYGCAVERVEAGGVRALLGLARGPCMQAPGLLRPAAEYAARIRAFAAAGWIDPPEDLAGDRLYAFTGEADAVVAPEVVRRGVALYAALGLAPTLFRDTDLDPRRAGHAWITNGFGGACEANADPYINDCQHDLSGEMLQAIHGPLAPPAAVPAGRLLPFDQEAFAPAGAGVPTGLWHTGYLYVPAACEPGAGGPPCRLHVVLHGCRQSAELLGELFPRKIGVNEWADTNRMLVLYPQARSVGVADFRPPRPTDLLEINLEGCWNWWGYARDERYLFKDGVQLGAIWAMVLRVSGRGNR